MATCGPGTERRCQSRANTLSEVTSPVTITQDTTIDEVDEALAHLHHDLAEAQATGDAARIDDIRGHIDELLEGRTTLRSA